MWSLLYFFLYSFFTSQSEVFDQFFSYIYVAKSIQVTNEMPFHYHRMANEAMYSGELGLTF